MAKNRVGVDSISGLSANKFHCPALAWKEQPVTLYSMISQIPGAGSTCYTLLESVKSTLSSANNCLFIFNFLVHEMQLPLLYNLDSTSACSLLPMVIQISSRLVLHQMKTRGKCKLGGTWEVPTQLADSAILIFDFFFSLDS